MPPIGYVLWMPPIITAGIVFPGMKWGGVVLALLLISSVAVIMNTCTKIYKKFFFILLAISILVNIINIMTPNKQHTSWTAINTHFGGSPKTMLQQIQRQRIITREVNIALDEGKKLIILPENMTNWLIGTQMLWKNTLKRLYAAHATVLIGRIRYEGNDLFSSGAEILNGHQAIYSPEKIPMPLGEWRPRLSTGVHFKADPQAREVFKFGHNAGIFSVCFEDFLMLPLLENIATTPPKLIVSINNQWFAQPSGFLKQTQAIASVGRLFSTPVLYANNTK